MAQDFYKFRYNPLEPLDDLLSRIPVCYVWDDHDAGKNDPDYMDFFYLTDEGEPALYPNLFQSYQEMFPHYELDRPDMGIWHKITYGNVDIFFVDNRSQREPNKLALELNETGDMYTAFNPGANHDILGGNPELGNEQDIQWDWLLNGLSNSTADWKFIASGVPFNPGIRLVLERAISIQGTDEDPINRHRPNSAGEPTYGTAFSYIPKFVDKWNGFPQSIERLLRHVIDDNIENVLIVSGDLHINAFDNGEHSLFPEMLASPLDRPNLHYQGVYEDELGVFTWNESDPNHESHTTSYGRVTVFGADSVRFESVNNLGEVLADMTIEPGYLPPRLKCMIAPEAPKVIEYDTVAVGDEAVKELLVYCSSIDPLEVSNIESDNSHFVVTETSFSLESGEVMRIDILYIPTVPGQTDEATITVTTNDGPYYALVSGHAVDPLLVYDDSVLTPSTFTLDQNYPNPFNPSTSICYTMPEAGSVSLSIYNTAGQLVKRLVKEDQSEGRYRVKWNGRNEANKSVASGIYFYTLSLGDLTKTRSMVLLK